jgi:serine/threonine protein kinase
VSFVPAPAGETLSRPRKRIGRYLVTGRIGRGGMGMVYRGLDETLEREVAIKTLTAEGLFDQESRKRFEIEAKAAARLQHPNILTVFELGEERGVPFIAMELLPGVDLETLLRSGEGLVLREKLEIVAQVCRGLAFAHEYKIVHRDIKPSNIRILDDGTAKIMDFGIAKLQGTGVTKSGVMVGTVYYMSPEQIRGKTIDGRSDVFSVGVILYELLAGKRPFPGESATEVLYKIVHEPAEPLPLPESLGTAGPRLEEIVEKALAKEAEERYANASLLAEALAEVAATLRPASAIPAEAVEAVNAGRRLVKEGRVDEALLTLKLVAEHYPESLEARRALRTAAREQSRRDRSPEPASDDFPELDATFKAPPTQTSPETETTLQPTEVQPAPTRVLAEPPAPARPARSSTTGMLVGVGAGILLLAGLGFFALRGSGGRSGASEPVAAATAHRIPVRSQPPGAEVFVDGQSAGVVTDGELVLPSSRQGQVLLTFKKPGYRDESRTLALPLGKDEGVAVTLGLAPATVAVITDPPGASLALDGQRVAGTTPADVRYDPAVEHRLAIALDGHTPQEVRLTPGKLPREVRLTLEPAGPVGQVAVASSYPVDVAWKGKVLAKGQVSPRVTLPQGRQVLSLSAPAVFLRTSVTLDVRAESSLQVPELGRINIRATPDNCEVFIDGLSAGYLPILDKPVAAGAHTVLFKWPDGVRRDESVEVTAGRQAYVMGRKE